MVWCISYVSVSVSVSKYSPVSIYVYVSLFAYVSAPAPASLLFIFHKLSPQHKHMLSQTNNTYIKLSQYL